jgi:hypothetical protein
MTPPSRRATWDLRPTDSRTYRAPLDLLVSSRGSIVSTGRGSIVSRGSIAST